VCELVHPERKKSAFREGKTDRQEKIQADRDT